MRDVERSAERDAAIAAMLPLVAEFGWTVGALRKGLGDASLDPLGAEWLFNGPTDMIETYLDLSDRRMAEAFAGFPAMRLSARIRALIALRLEQAHLERPAARRAAAVLALPGHAMAASRTLARTVDAIWRAAGDTSADFSWYTKRASLAAIYGSTMVYWLNQDADADPDNERTLGFLDRRLAMLGRMGKLRARLTADTTACTHLAPA
jgi:ubiquinone biosynthesis protein COQ9